MNGFTLRRNGRNDDSLHREFAFNGARDAVATAICRDSPIPAAQHLHYPGEIREPDQRVSPPDFASHCHRCVGTAIMGSIAQKKSHFAQQFLARHSQQNSYSRILQGRERQTAAMQCRREEAGDPGAKCAVGIIKKPSAGVGAFSVGEFGGQRNHKNCPGNSSTGFAIAASE